MTQQFSQRSPAEAFLILLTLATLLLSLAPTSGCDGGRRSDNLNSLEQQPVGGLKTEFVNDVEVCSGRLLVKFSSPPELPKIQAMLKQVSGRDASVEDLGVPGLFLIKTPDVSAGYLIEQFNKVSKRGFEESGILYSELDYVIRAASPPTDPYFGCQWGLNNLGMPPAFCAGMKVTDEATDDADIDAPGAWKEFSDGFPTASPTPRPVVVAVLDTGIKFGHEDLRDAIWHSTKELNFTFDGTPIKCPKDFRGFDALNDSCDRENNKDGLDEDGHGTRVAGIIGASWNQKGIAGINPAVKLLSVKVLNGAGRGCTSDAMKGLKFLQEVKRQGLADVRVLNNSYGCDLPLCRSCGHSSTAMKEAIMAVGELDMLFVAAAGNSGQNNNCAASAITDEGCAAFFPASFVKLPNLISVAAINSVDGLYPDSNHGTESVHLGAPGQAICTTRLKEPFYDPVNKGTSMAAAFVSGSASLLLSHPDCNPTAAQLSEFLVKGVEQKGASVGKTIARGRLNVHGALRQCLGR